MDFGKDRSSKGNCSIVSAVKAMMGQDRIKHDTMSDGLGLGRLRGQRNVQDGQSQRQGRLSGLQTSIVEEAEGVSGYIK